MEREYNLLIEKNIWKLKSPINRTNVITKKWYVELEKDWFGYILKYKAQ